MLAVILGVAIFGGVVVFMWKTTPVQRTDKHHPIALMLPVGHEDKEIRTLLEFVQAHSTVTGTVHTQLQAIKHDEL